MGEKKGNPMEKHGSTESSASEDAAAESAEESTTQSAIELYENGIQNYLYAAGENENL